MSDWYKHDLTGKTAWVGCEDGIDKVLVKEHCLKPMSLMDKYYVESFETGETRVAYANQLCETKEEAQKLSAEIKERVRKQREKQLEEDFRTFRIKYEHDKDFRERVDAYLEGYK